MICCLNTHIQCVKVWLKSVLPRLKYRIFSMGLFFYWRTHRWLQILNLGELNIILMTVFYDHHSLFSVVDIYFISTDVIYLHLISLVGCMAQW